MNEIKLNSKVVATSEYDAIGRQTKLIDINAGTSTYTYTPFGEMKTSTNANGANRTKEYDEFGRLILENIDGYIINYEYVAEGNGLKQLKKISTADGMEEIYDYDELGRVHTLTENIQGELFMFTYTYNELNQPESITYPSGLVVYNVYDDKGTLIKVTDAQGEIYWEGLEQDAFGRFTSFMKGDGVTTTYEFDAFQQLEEIKAGNVQHHTYQWDNQTGNLSERKDLIYGLQESFTYDNLNRLETGVASSITGGFVLNSISTEYEGNGNIAYKNDAGTYAYHEEKINAVITATNDIGQISGLTQDISYTTRQKAEFISEGGHTLNFVYGHDNHRRKTIYSSPEGEQLEKYFIGLYEKEIEDNTIRHINYIMAGDGMTAIVVQEEENNTLTEETYYTYKDHLGSIVALTDESGDVVLEQSFDAWGRYRNPVDWTYNDVEEMPTWLRGYTGHEHLPHFDLINMNGRVYDPILGRMLSPDIYVQDPLFSQSYNRYSYCWNNPLRYTDPSGDIIAFTDFGYNMWKFISPVAFKINFNTSSSGTSIGVDASVGVPQKILIHARIEGGVSYHFQDNKNNYQGWEYRYGFEIGLGPIKSANVNYVFQDSKYNQSTNVITIGGPKINFKYENDFMFGLPADGGDRYRTAAGRLSIGRFKIGFNLYTGDPGLTTEERNPQTINGQLTYLKSEFGDDPDEYRSGVLYFGYGNIKIGRNSEKIRHAIQNVFAHDIAYAWTSGGKKLPHFAIDNSFNPKWYWGFGTGTGNSLW